MNSRKIVRKQVTTKPVINFFTGLFLLCISLIFAFSLAVFEPGNAGVFTFPKEGTSSVLNLGSYIADILTQFFGIFSYVITCAIFIWGYSFLSGKILEITHKLWLFSGFVLVGCVVFNIASTNSTCEGIIRKLGIDYYAGGLIGYSLSKIIFIDFLKQAVFYKWAFIGISIVWFLIAKKVLFIKFGPIIDLIYTIFDKWAKKFEDDKRVYLDNDRVVWDNPIGEGDEVIDRDQFRESASIEFEASLEKKENHGCGNFGDLSGMIAGSGEYLLPGVELLDKHNQSIQPQDEKKISNLSVELCNVLEEFGIKGEILKVRYGPVVTMFEFRPSPGIKTSRVISLSDDIARSMSAVSARISTIPGQNAIGIELPNKHRHTVYLRELLSSEAFHNFTTGIPLILGKDISGNPILADLTKMPHLLVAGTTGSGKSVSINDMILSILFKFSPSDCKLIMIDPKMLELSVYDEIPHLLTPVVTDPKKAIFALKWAVGEMEGRYRMMSKLGVRNIDGFNKRLRESREKGDMLVRKVQIGFDQDTGRPIFETQQLDFDPMPYIVVIVDEMADLMLVAGKEVEAAIQRLAQMARAAGIHLIMATQRPSVDVITGTIKANFPTRISFQVTSKIDSRTILGEQGAEQLLGQGDMLYMSGAGRILRVHGPFVRDTEVERIVLFIKGQGEPNYVDIISGSIQDDSKSGSEKNQNEDQMYQKAVEIVTTDKKVSISYLQRRLQIGYNRAARIVEELEGNGIVSAPDHTGKRKVII
ncbi:MAG: DNA translocase FtsK 4TM domain-containing protein [Holosporales bacterium]|jgi:S-DNA-T family DNA segregation ATPase FtsK/SpoIIIE|nr:DNA translocase FtsK 4TM domain-containing protein [Holosporales bacterium]